MIDPQHGRWRQNKERWQLWFVPGFLATSSPTSWVTPRARSGSGKVRWVWGVWGCPPQARILDEETQQDGEVHEGHQGQDQWVPNDLQEDGQGAQCHDDHGEAEDWCQLQGDQIFVAGGFGIEPQDQHHPEVEHFRPHSMWSPLPVFPEPLDNGIWGALKSTALKNFIDIFFCFSHFIFRFSYVRYFPLKTKELTFFTAFSRLGGKERSLLVPFFSRIYFKIK